ncbi:MAG: thioredoxin [Intestinimonas sp.]|jgi:thioredoxin 1|nr:thioredoxin [Intestinimonas sp.]
MSVFSIYKNNFKAEVLNSDKPVLIDLWATWCGPCRMMSPVVEEIAAAHPEIKVCKINVDDEPELAQAFQVSAIPTLVLVEGGKVKNMTVGFRPKDQIENMLR